MLTARWQLAAAALVASAVLSGLLVGSALSWKHGGEIASLKLEHREQMVKGWQAAAKVNAEVTEQYHEDIATIAARPLPRPVLVCPPGGVVLPGAAPGAGAEAAGGPPQPTGGEAQRDIGAFLASESDRADRAVTQLNALIDWVHKVRAPNEL